MRRSLYAHTLSQPDSSPKASAQPKAKQEEQSLMERVESSPSWEAMPFEAHIAIKMLLTFLDSLDPTQRAADNAISVQMMRGFLPILKSLILSLSSKQYALSQSKDFGLLDTLCAFLRGMMTASISPDCLSDVVCLVPALSIISSDFDSIVFVLHHLLTHKHCQVCSRKFPENQAHRILGTRRGCSCSCPSTTRCA